MSGIDLTPEAVADLCGRMDEWWEYQHGHLIAEAAATLRALSSRLAELKS